jgi:hypothetical protein
VSADCGEKYNDWVERTGTAVPGWHGPGLRQPRAK